MFDLVGPLEVLLPLLGAAAALGAVGLGTRQGIRALSVDGRTARARRQQLVRLRQLTGLRIAEDTGALHGRMNGWMFEVHRAPSSSSGLDAGDDPHGSTAGCAGLIGYVPVPDRFAAACDRANRHSFRLVDVDPKHPSRSDQT